MILNLQRTASRGSMNYQFCLIGLAILTWCVESAAENLPLKACGLAVRFQSNELEFAGSSEKDLGAGIAKIIGNYSRTYGGGGSFLIFGPIADNNKFNSSLELGQLRVTKIRQLLVSLGIENGLIQTLYVHKPVDKEPIVDLQYCRLPDCSCEIPKKVIESLDIR